MAEISTERFSHLRERSGLTQPQFGELLGVTGKYVGMIERGEKKVDESSPLGLLFALLEGESMLLPGKVAGEPLSYHANRKVPVIGWAHAGEAVDYDELPEDWQELIPTECRDPKAFAVRLEGESMLPRFEEGDLLVLMPSEEIYNGCLAVIRLANDGVIFRRVEKRPDILILVPLNPNYRTEEFKLEDVLWAYPLWGGWRQIWKR